MKPSCTNLLAVLALSGALWGQSETTSAITGEVLDQSGGAVAGATVTVTQGETGAQTAGSHRRIGTV